RLTLTYDDGLANQINEDEDVGGFHLGTGLEVGLGSRIYTRLDYIYTRYDDDRFVEEGTEVVTEMKRHQLLLGVGIRF
ncbi:MAG TPA: hypothetical protein VGB54_02040, partial [Allosphingosinicella sp.]